MIANPITIHRTVGQGREAVYAYSFPSLIEGDRWPCKVGRSSSDPIRRILAQQASMQEKPIVGILIKTDNSKHVERSIHTALAERKLDTFGNEWFLTNPNEIESAAMTATDNPSSIGDMLRLARHERRLSQTQVADLANVRQATVSLIENGGNASIQTVENICRALGKRIVIVD